MSTEESVKYWAVFVLAAVSIAVIAKLVLGIAITASLIVLSLWPFIGLLVQIDDWFPGGWSNRDGNTPLPKSALGLRAGLLLATVGLHGLVQTLA